MAAKNKNKLAWIIVIIAVVVIAVVAIVTTIFFGNNPEKTIEETFTALKEGNLELIDEYIATEDSNSLIENEITDTLKTSLENSDFERDLINSCFSQFEWQIKETKIEGNTAVVTVDITNKDFSNVVQEVFSKMLTQALSTAVTGEEMTEEETLNLIKESIDEVTDTTTITKEINLVKENGTWKFNATEVMNIVLPGIIDGLESLQNYLRESYGIDSEYNDYGL